MLLPLGPSPRCIRSIVSFVSAGLALASLSCTPPSSSSGSAPSVSTPAASSSVSITSASPLPSASPASAVCPYGTGTLEGECRRLADEVHVADVNAAIDRLAQHHPEYFDLTNTAGPGEWRVLQPHAYLGGLVDELRTAGLCAETDQSSIVSVKGSNDLSEDYNVLLPTDHVQRGNPLYAQTCRPASFPVDPREAIAYVRVHFYSVNCPDGMTAPRNGADELPLGCRGFLTATPKQRNNLDVPVHIVANDITWWTAKGADKIEVHDYPDHNDFNKILVPRSVGAYQICASSHGVVGCQDAEVLAQPR
jgi:hypothetical protein